MRRVILILTAGWLLVPARAPAQDAPPAGRVLTLTVAIDLDSGATRVVSSTLGPAVAPAPPGVPGASDPLATAARAYIAGIPAAFRKAAVAVRDATPTTAVRKRQDVVNTLGRAVDQVTAPLSKALGVAVDAACDQFGAIRDREMAARALELAAQAMEQPTPTPGAPEPKP
jgi:hypothetical protein